jgi:hypothetical protein
VLEIQRPSRVDPELKERIRELLERHPNNFSFIAKELCISRDKVVAIVEEENLSNEDELLDQVEEQLILFATGRIETLSIKFNEALKLLSIKRPDRWGSKVKPTQPTRKMPARFATDLLESLKARASNGTAPSSPSPDGTV